MACIVFLRDQNQIPPPHSLYVTDMFQILNSNNDVSGMQMIGSILGSGNPPPEKSASKLKKRPQTNYFKGTEFESGIIVCQKYMEHLRNRLLNRKWKTMFSNFFALSW